MNGWPSLKIIRVRIYVIMDKQQAISLGLQGLLQPELRDDEEILWFAAPQRRPFLSFSPLLMFAGLFLVVISGYLVSSIYADFTGFSDASRWQLFSILTLVFLLAFGAVILWQQLMNRMRLNIYIYAVTDHRIIISSHKRGETEIRTFPLTSIRFMNRISGRRGLEHLIFADEHDPVADVLSASDRAIYRQARRSEVGFFNIPNAREVEQIILEAQEKLMGAKPV